VQRLIRTLRWCNILLILFTFLVYFTPFVNPQGKWPLAVIGLFYPAILVIHLLFILLWSVLRKWQFLLSLGCILIGWGHVRTVISFSSTNNLKEKEPTEITIMTFNCFSFSKDAKGTQLINKEKLTNLLREYQPDILCLQEFANTENQLKLFKEWVETSHDFSHNFIQTTASLAIFSRYPLHNTKAQKFPNSYNGYQQAEVIIGDQQIGIFNLHLQTNAITSLANKVVDSGDLKTKETWLDIGGMLRSYQRAARKRVVQAEEVRAEMANVPHPVVICGDFNDVPQSYVYRLLKQGYTDTFQKAGNGMGVTYSGKIPGLRIDYIFTPPSFTVLQTLLPKPGFSDHRPVVSRVAIGTNEK